MFEKKSQVLEISDNIDDIFFTYLFKDFSEYHNKFYTYTFVEDSLQFNQQSNTLICKLLHKESQEYIEIKLSYKDGKYFILSDFLASSNEKYTVTCFKSKEGYIFYRDFGDGELYLHVAFNE